MKRTKIRAKGEYETWLRLDTLEEVELELRARVTAAVRFWKDESCYVVKAPKNKLDAVRAFFKDRMAMLNQSVIWRPMGFCEAWYLRIVWYLSLMRLFKKRAGDA